MNKFDNDLNEALTRGNGIALIVFMVECPKCSKDIWVEIGSHCGYDGILDFNVNTHCYECCELIKVIVEASNIKDTGFMTIPEFADFTNDKFIKNRKI